MIPNKAQWKNWSLPSKYTALGLLVGILSLGATVYFSSPSVSNADEYISLQGEYELVSLGVHEINYGANFRSKPVLKFLGGEYGGISNPEGFKILEQRTDGFTFEVSGALTGGTTIIWEVTGNR